ncbi:hypothetical protein [Desulfovibrio sp. TomC]|uniref:hypothetical protein n=1 Tax=Desulfovibrio sp. TomC TaxID=1562888 RepID=UPI0005740E68|nr:hypothetical protein [Desulfovibrio sp. TomC]KHK03396.1 hypothetical protein NY78_0981 [Desulfovibrio sp. TomC]
MVCSTTDATAPTGLDGTRPGALPQIPGPFFTAKRLGLIAAGLVALVQLLCMAGLIGPGLVSSYPDIEYDGYDWVLEGLYIRAFVHGAVDGPLFFLRSPVFVLVTTLDAFLGSSGLVVVGSLCLAHFLSLAALLSIWRRFRVSGSTQAALFAMAVLSPYAFFRSFILADPLAIAGALVSTRLMLEWFLTDDARQFRAAGAVGLLAGLTQLYGILPFLAGAVLSWAHDRRTGRPGWSRVLFSAAVVGLAGLLLFIWNAAIPHEQVPVQFPLLRLSLDMAGFYANVWTWYYSFLVPIALVLAVAAAKHRPGPFSPATGFLATITGLLIGLLFFYQSEEARFSWYYFPLILCLAAAGLAWLERIGWGRAARVACAASLALLLSQAVAVTPGDYWQPKIRDIQCDPGETWLGLLLRARRVDRLNLAEQCGAPGFYCRKAQMPAGIEPDEQRLLQDYVRLRILLDAK